MATTPQVVLVDRDDVACGTADKLQAHYDGALHRAFSIFLFDGGHRLLLQRRALAKYHSPGLWTNTCCSHPAPGEAVIDAAHRRLREEMGIDCTLTAGFSFIYKADLTNGLVEHEFDHVLLGRFDGQPCPNDEEVDNWKWASLEEIRRDIAARPDTYTVWFRLVFDRVSAHVAVPAAVA